MTSDDTDWPTGSVVGGPRHAGRVVVDEDLSWGEMVRVGLLRLLRRSRRKKS